MKMRTVAVVLALVTGCSGVTTNGGAGGIEAPLALVMTATRVVHDSQNPSRVWLGIDVEVDADAVRFRRCDESGECATHIEVAPIGDFLGVTDIPDSQLRQLRFREGSPIDRRLASLAKLER